MLNIEIISPLRIVFQGQAHMVVVPSVAGESGVMEGHEAFVSELQAGKISVFNDKQEIIAEAEVANGGFAEIHDGKKLVILLDS